MPTVTKPYGDFVNNLDVADAAKVNAQINTLYNSINGQLDLTNISSSAVSTTPIAGKLAEYDTNSNVPTALPVSTGQNPNLLFNPSGRLGLQGWTVTNAGGSAWNAQFGNGGEGSYFGCGSVTNATPILESSKFPVFPGSTYSLSGEMFTSGVTVGKQVIDIEFFDTNNISLGALGRTVAVNGSNWTRYTSGNITVPANATGARVRLYGDTGFTTTNSAWRKVKVEVGSIVTTFSDDNTLNTNQYGSVLGLTQALSGGYKSQDGELAATAAGSYSVTFPQAFNTITSVRATYYSNGNASSVPVTVTAKSTTGATFYIASGFAGGTIEWEAKGT